MNTQILPCASVLRALFLAWALALAAVLLVTFSGEQASAAETSDTTAPTVSGISPAHRASNVARNTSVTATFSEEMEPATLTTSTVTLVKYGTRTPISATVSYDAASKKVTLKPSAILAAKTYYVATVKGGASGVKDKAGNPLAANKVWYFYTNATTPSDTTTEPSTTTAQVSLGVYAGQDGGDGGAWESSTMTAVHQFEQQVGAKPEMIHMFFPMFISGSCANLPPGPSTALKEGYKPLFTWEVVNYGGGTAPNLSYAGINSGSLDACFRQFANQAKTLNGPLYLRPFHEMNGGWYPWAVAGKEQAHINAWRRMVDIFRAAGANNVKFVWCPNERFSGDAGPYANYYPGDAYVEYLCLDGYNWSSANGSPWQSFNQIYRDSYDEIAALPSSDPLMIGEYASHTGPGDKAQWINDMRASVKSGSYPRLKVMNWFNQNRDNATWQVDSSQAVLDAYRAFVADTYFQKRMPSVQ